MGSTFYASGSADAFLADRGFDDKWVQKEERKKDVWEEVKTNRKKQLSGAEKRAKAAKISVRADILMKVMREDVIVCVKTEAHAYSWGRLSRCVQ